MKTQIKIISGLIIFIIALPAFSQMIGNPVGVQGPNAWTVSASMGYLRHQEGDYENMTERMVLKSRYAVTSWLDVFGLLGGYKLRRMIDSQTIEDYNGKYSLGYGGGINISKDQLIGSLNFWFTGHFVRFPSKGFLMEYFVEGDGLMKGLDYDSREYQYAAGFKIPNNQFNIYIGAVVWGIQRLEEQSIYQVSQDGAKASVPYQVNEGTYQSSAWTGGLLGVEVKLPNKFTAGIEFTAFNEKNYQIMFGISQTVGSDW